MKADIRVNYSILREIVADLQSYKIALETIEEELKNVNIKLEENKGEAIGALKESYDKIKKNYDSCYSEICALEDIFSNYINDMTEIIKPISEADMVRVDRTDIWWNLNSIVSACDSVGMVASGTGNGYDFFHIFQDEDEEAKAIQNEEKIEIIRDEIRKCSASLKIDSEAMEDLFNSKIVKYENMDDAYKKKANNLYDNYSNFGEKVVDSISFEKIWARRISY